MQKVLLVTISVLFYFINAMAQDTAAVSIPLTLYDEEGGMKILYFGVDSTATDSIDLNLGEAELPPPPPAGFFDARWILPVNGFNGSLSSWVDYRYASEGIFTDTLEYRLKYQGSENADTMFFEWDFPAEITASLQDLITGTIVNVFMSGSGVYGLANFSVLNQMKFLVYYNIVPVELTSFTANVNKNTVVLNWTTVTELNNKGFEIERQVGSRQSALGNWENIGYVPGYGTTTEPKSYSYTDNGLSEGTYCYRLKQMDFDGTFEYSNEVTAEISVTTQFALEQNYPNPFNPTTKIKYSIADDGFVIMSVYNSIGEKVTELVSSELVAGSYEVEFDASKLSSGIYFYKIESSEFIDVKKMILLR